MDESLVVVGFDEHSDVAVVELDELARMRADVSHGRRHSGRNAGQDGVVIGIEGFVTRTTLGRKRWVLGKSGCVRLRGGPHAKNIIDWCHEFIGATPWGAPITQH